MCGEGVVCGERVVCYVWCEMVVVWLEWCSVCKRMN